MKRKRSQDLAASHACPKVAKQCTPQLHQGSDNVEPCRLLQLLSQYGILISILSNLEPEDMFSLAATSKSTFGAMIPEEGCAVNLLRQIPCAGKGIAIRRVHHQRSNASTGPRCIRYDVCGSKSGRFVETHPCINCKHTTCDECRIHCVFNSTIEPADELDELPTHSGFVLLSGADMHIETPAHLQQPGPSAIVPFHDRGFLNTPWKETTPAARESVADLIDFNLGEGVLRGARDSVGRHPSSVIRGFYEYSEERKLKMCDPCREQLGVAEFHPENPLCDCTLRDQILGRWLCLECFKEEAQIYRDYTRDQTERRWSNSDVAVALIRCFCGHRLNGSGRLVCLWCRGEIAEDYSDG